VEGKAISRLNGYRHGCRSAEIRHAEKSIAQLKKVFNQLIKTINLND